MNSSEKFYYEIGADQLFQKYTFESTNFDLKMVKKINVGNKQIKTIFFSYYNLIENFIKNILNGNNV